MNGDCSSENSSESEEILEANSDYVSVFCNTGHTLTSFYKQPFGSVAYITGHKTNLNLLWARVKVDHFLGTIFQS